ncbi:oxalurate catabolism protein HpxZ [Acidobacteria bacterium AB60]|nr:oxalurate catabolism protein HpxZ [Acidobacteria bacterium AB60]
MIINDPAVIAELAALYSRYEDALVTNDVDTLMSMFWDGDQVMRFGVSENLYGPEQLQAFRRGRPAANLARTIERIDIVSFGSDFASITLEFKRDVHNKIVCGRQSQTWVRMPEGWRIVAAHVSLLAES